MGKKIVIIQCDQEEIFPLLSMIIGLKKANPKSYIIWAGDPYSFDLVRYNKRIKQILDVTQEFSLKTLEIIFGADICVNASKTTISKQFASKVKAKETFGFTQDGATSKQAEFLQNVLLEKISTKKTLLQMYYDLVGLRWNGEGYGLSYYPKTKQIAKCGVFLQNNNIDIKNCTKINMPNHPLKCLDIINKFKEIVTDDLFTAHASVALRKKCTLFGNWTFHMEFFGKGSLKSFDQ